MVVQGREHQVLVHRAGIDGLGVGVPVVGGAPLAGRPDQHLRPRPAAEVVSLRPADAAPAVEPVAARVPDVSLQPLVVVDDVGGVAVVDDQRSRQRRPGDAVRRNGAPHAGQVAQIVSQREEGVRALAQEALGHGAPLLLGSGYAAAEEHLEPLRAGCGRIQEDLGALQAGDTRRRAEVERARGVAVPFVAVGRLGVVDGLGRLVLTRRVPGAVQPVRMDDPPAGRRPGRQRVALAGRLAHDVDAVRGVTRHEAGRERRVGAVRVLPESELHGRAIRLGPVRPDRPHLARQHVPPVQEQVRTRIEAQLAACHPRRPCPPGCCLGPCTERDRVVHRGTSAV